MVYGTYPLAEEQNEAYYTPMAEQYNFFQLLLYKQKKSKHHHNEWEAGALRLSNPLIMKIINI